MILPLSVRSGFGFAQVYPQGVDKCWLSTVLSTGCGNPNARRFDKESMEVMMNEPTKQASWQDFLDPDAPLTEDSVWQAIADANDLDYSEIADGDILDYL